MTALVIKAFKNPFYSVGIVLASIWAGMIAMGEQAGRSRAASELARMGYYDEAKNLMLDRKDKNVQLERTIESWVDLCRHHGFLGFIFNTKRTTLRRSNIMWPYTDEENDMLSKPRPRPESSED